MRAAVQLLKHQVELVLLLEELDQLDDVVLAAAHVVDLDLLQQLASEEGAGPLLYDLDCVLEAAVDRLAGLHQAVAALAQHLPRHLVQVCEALANKVSHGLLLLPPLLLLLLLLLLHRAVVIHRHPLLLLLLLLLANHSHCSYRISFVGYHRSVASLWRLNNIKSALSDACVTQSFSAAAVNRHF